MSVGRFEKIADALLTGDPADEHHDRAGRGRCRGARARRCRGREVLVGVDAVVDHLYPRRVDRRVDPQHVVTHAPGHGDHGVGRSMAVRSHPARQARSRRRAARPSRGAAAPGCERSSRGVRRTGAWPGTRRSWRTRCGCGPGRRPDVGGHAQIDGHGPQSRARRRHWQRVPGLVGARHQRGVAGRAEAVAPRRRPAWPSSRAQVLDVHPGAPVYLGRVLPGQQGDLQVTRRTFSPLPMTTTPRAEIGEAAGVELRVDAQHRRPARHLTFLSMMARRTTAPCPMRTLSISTESSTSAPVLDEHARGYDRPPDRAAAQMITPRRHDRVERLPVRPASSKTNLAGGSCGARGEDRPLGGCRG